MNIKNNIFLMLRSPIAIRIYIAGLTFLSSVVINRSIGIELKGQYTTILNYSNYVQMLLNLGICYSYASIIKKYGREKAKQSIVTLIWLQTFIYMGISLTVGILADNVAYKYIAFISTTIICNGQISFLAMIDNIKSRNRIVFLYTLINLLLNIVAIYFARGSLEIIICFLIGRYILETILLAKWNGYLYFEVRILNKEIVKMIMSIGLPTAFMSFLIACNYNMDIIMLNVMKSNNYQIGIYGVAYSLSNMLWILPDAFKEMVYHKTAKEDNARYILKCIVANIVMCLMICIGFSLLGKEFLRIVYGEEFVVAYDVTLTLFFGILPMIAFKLIHPIYVNNGKTKTVAMLLLIAVLSNIIISYMLIPQYGALGAAIASVVSYTICGILFLTKFFCDYILKR